MNLLKTGVLAALAVASSAAYSQFTFCAGVGTGGGLQIGSLLRTSPTIAEAFGRLGSVAPDNLVSIGNFAHSTLFQVIVKNGPKEDYYAWNYSISTGAYLGYTRLAASVPDGKCIGVGDFDGDTQFEFVVVNPLGKAFAYEINRTTGLFSERLALGLATSGEFDKAVGVADADDDGDYDIVLQSSATNRIAYRYYSGTTREGTSGAVTDGSAQVVAPAGVVVGATNVGGFRIVIRSSTNNNLRLWRMTGTVRDSNDVLTGWGATKTIVIGKRSS